MNQLLKIAGRHLLQVPVSSARFNSILSSSVPEDVGDAALDWGEGDSYLEIGLDNDGVQVLFEPHHWLVRKVWIGSLPEE